MSLRRLLPLLLAAPLAAAPVCAFDRPPAREAAAEVAALPLPVAALDRPVSFARDVRPVLDARCVSCHACYDGPCQLLLSSPEGVVRGASKEVVYDTTRLHAAPPTRLFVDARDPAGWRRLGFFSVLAGRHDPPPAADAPATPPVPAAAALLVQMLALGAAHPLPPGERLPADVPLGIDRSLTCARPDEFPDYARAHPRGGMPYGLAPLATGELQTLVSWVQQGAKLDATPAPLPASAHQQVARWEAFLNGTSTKQRLVARYLYEHWFVAHLHFADAPAGPFFRVVRSRTPSGQPVDEIATRRPYDDPGPALFYRLVPIEDTIAHKTHIVYELSPARMERLTALFLADDWQATALPGYAPEVASNPFVAFAEIPPGARYRFLLDDAHFFVDTFIRGPVCRGQVAVDVIEDRFWVSFLAPAHDLSVTDPAFMARTKQLLEVPSEDAGWIAYDRKQRRYLNERARLYAETDPQRLGPAPDWVWDGDGHDRDALLTVFRNFDNATVVRGWWGAIPKTAWILDYPLFERIYYDLVAGYDVFGAVTHQVATRLYMDHLRMQSENLFLHFLPKDRREEIRASWYVGATRQVDYFLADRLHGQDLGTQVRFSGPDVKAELLQQILQRAAAVAGPPDTLNRCARPPCDRPGATPVERSVERALQGLAAVRGPWVAPLPEVSWLRVRVDPSGQRDLVYSLVHDDAHTNVAFLFQEQKRRLPEDDTVSVLRGFFGSYPNYVFEVEAAQVPAFVAELRAIAGPEELAALATRRGLRRTAPRFWSSWDWLGAASRRAEPITAGVYDLGRYVDP